MKDCPVINRIHEARRKISEEHENDTEKLLKHYQEMGKNTKRKFFRREVPPDEL